MAARTLNQNDVLTFSFHNESRQDYYSYLINISADGGIYAAFPNPQEGQEYARIKAGEKRVISAEEALLLLTSVGEQTFKLIATTQPIDVSLLEQDPFRQRNQSTLNPLERLLTSAVHGQRGLAPVQNDDWVTGQVTFEVRIVD